MIGNPNSQELAKSVAEQMGERVSVTNFQEHAKNLAEQMKAIMSDPRLQKQAKLFAEQMEDFTSQIHRAILDKEEIGEQISTSLSPIRMHNRVSCNYNSVLFMLNFYEFGDSVVCPVCIRLDLVCLDNVRQCSGGSYSYCLVHVSSHHAATIVCSTLCFEHKVFPCNICSNGRITAYVCKGHPQQQKLQPQMQRQQHPRQHWSVKARLAGAAGTAAVAGTASAAAAAGAASATAVSAVSTASLFQTCRKHPSDFNQSSRLVRVERYTCLLSVGLSVCP